MALFETANLRVELLERGIAILWLDVADRSHNVFNRQMLVDLDAALNRVSSEASASLLIITSAKSSGFIAGADLREFAQIRSAQEAMALSTQGQDLMNKLAALALPTAAVIRGPCLGGGLEFALACDYRIVVDEPATQLGLPEVELGLIPGWGGTQRLPRLIGLERSLHIILQRRRLNAREAVRWRLADTALGTQEAAVRFVQESFLHGRAFFTKRPAARPSRHTWRQKLVESTSMGRWLLFRGADRLLRKRVPEDMPAPAEALQAIRVGLTQGMEEGLVYERTANSVLCTTTACRNLMSLFFMMEKARKATPAVSDNVALPRLVGIVGSGTMGAGIAQLAALKGFSVVIQEVDEKALRDGLTQIRTLFDRAVERGLLSRVEADKRIGALRGTTSWEGFADVDLVIEAIHEDRELKQRVFRTLEERVRPDALLATNTSSLLVADLQQNLSQPQRVAGLHFFNPVHKLPLVEIVRAASSTPDTVDRLRRFAIALGKTPVVVGDGPGFLVNRVLMPYLNEAGQLLAQGCPIQVIDGTVRRFGMPMGPFELLDQVGLQVALHIAMELRSKHDADQPVLATLKRMVANGCLGQKSGKGFYIYRGRKKYVNAQAMTELQSQFGSMTEAPSADEVRHRLIYLMVNEAADCLGEGLADTADAIDLAMVLGTGWAPHRGGPLRFADDVGVKVVFETLHSLAAQFGPRFEPCAELRRRAATGSFFHGGHVQS